MGVRLWRTVVMTKPQTSQSTSSGNEATSTTQRVAVLFKAYSATLVGVVLFMLVLTGVNMLRPFFIKLLFDEVFPGQGNPLGNLGLLMFILLGVMIVYVARNILFYYSKSAAVTVGENFCFTIRKRLFEYLQQLNMRFFRQNNAGEVSSRLMNDSFVIQQFIADDLPKLLQAIFTFVGVLAIIYAVNWPLALVSTIVLPLHLLTHHYFKRPIKEASREASSQLSLVHGDLIEKFLGAEVVKGFAGEQRESEAFGRAIDRSRKSQLKSKSYHIVQKVIADLLVGVGTVGLLGFGAYQVLKPVDPMRAGTFIMFFAYVGMLYPTVIDLMSGLAKFTRTTASVDRIFDMLQTGQQEQQLDHEGPKPPIRGELVFRNGNIGYVQGIPVLKKVSFTVSPGQVCAIVGPSGAGKSTLVSLLPLFNEATRGSVELDGLDVKDIDLTYLRQNIGVAFQECFLFNSSIEENLRYANPNATTRQIMDVAKRTGADDFIQKLPDGYETLVGENGVNLSRGEKQRITWMRAMLKKPKIVILDEATASLDAASESQVIPAILEFMHGKTTLMITHRPQLLEHADQVIQLQEGRVVYQGSSKTFDHEAFAGNLVSPSPVQRDTKEGSDRWPVLRNLAMLLSMGLVGTSLIMTTPAMAATAAEKVTAKKTAPKISPKVTKKTIQKSTIPHAIFEPMVGLNDLQVAELLDVIAAKLKAQGYSNRNQADHRKQMPQLEDYRNVQLLSKTQGAAVHLVQLGLKTFRSQPVHLWIAGTIVQGNTQKPMDLEPLKASLAQARKSLQTHQETLKVGDLAIETLRLSYIEPDRCLAVLKTLGYQVIEYKAGAKGPGRHQMINPDKKVDPKNLPVVVAVPGTDATQLVGGIKVAKGAFGLTMTPSIPSPLPDHTAAAPLMELLILHDPARPQQHAKLLDLIHHTIDVPARQILVEAMVLEISKSALDQLGVQWELQTAKANLTSLQIGRLPDLAAGETPAMDIGLGNIFGEFKIQLQALVSAGKAKILSRPSVLTLDNRQASIRVGEEIPVATSTAGAITGDKISFKFQYIPIGILLNVRPRVSRNGDYVSMQIDGIVSAKVPGEDLELRDTKTNEILASAPQISTRRVQTYSRVANNTPFIIGGLIAEDDVDLEKKVPLLGDIPLIGKLFTSSAKAKLKREVIIVITPYVLPTNQLAGRNMPKDEDSFDSFGNELFRDAYRIRAADVFDLTFLREHLGLQRLTDLTNQVVSRNASLAQTYPFDRFVENRIPGERILVYRQMYGVIKRHHLDEQIRLRKLIFFEPQKETENKGAATGFEVRFLLASLEKQLGLGVASSTDEPDLERLFGALKGKAVALTWTRQRYTQKSRDLLAQPVPQVSIVDCADRQAWSNELWTRNQIDKNGNQRYTILLHSAKDLDRLKRAIILKQTVAMNARENAITLANFAVGRQLLMPTVKRDKVYLVDDQVAKYFFYTELYYPAVREELQRDAEALKNMLKASSMRRLLDDPNGADRPAQWKP